MAELSPMRFSADTLRRLDDLATSVPSGARGGRTQAARECIHYWHQAVVDACVLLAEKLKPDDWRRIALAVNLDREPDDYPDWSIEFAEDLRDVAGRVPAAERRHLLRLADVVGGFELAEGYAVYSAVRWHAANPEVERWWEPERWLGAGEVAVEGEE